jgi:hypothetical protein
MKLTKSKLKQIIKEELNLVLEEAPPQASALAQKMRQVSQNLSGIQSNELELVNFFLDLINLAKKENINVPDLRRRLGLVKQAAEKI